MTHARKFPDWVPALSITEFLKSQGLPVTRTRLVRWHKAHLIPRPRRTWPTGKRGSRTEYPAIVLAQSLLVALVLRDISRSFDVARWVLWYYGFPGFTEPVRRFLLRDMRARRRELERGYAAFVAERDNNPIDLASAVPRAPRLWADERRWAGRTHAATAVRIAHEVMLGNVEALSRYDADDFRIVGRALANATAIDAFRTAEAGDVRGGLGVAAAEANITRIAEALAAAPESLLVFIRDEAAALHRLLHPELPATWASVPDPAFFLAWFGQRHVSPTLNAEISKLAEKPGWPDPEEPMLYRIARAQMAAASKKTKRPTRPGKKGRKRRRRS